MPQVPLQSPQAFQLCEPVCFGIKAPEGVAVHQQCRSDMEDVISPEAVAGRGRLSDIMSDIHPNVKLILKHGVKA